MPTRKPRVWGGWPMPLSAGALTLLLVLLDWMKPGPPTQAEIGNAFAHYAVRKKLRMPCADRAMGGKGGGHCKIKLGSVD